MEIGKQPKGAVCVHLRISNGKFLLLLPITIGKKIENDNLTAATEKTKRKRMGDGDRPEDILTAVQHFFWK